MNPATWIWIVLFSSAGLGYFMYGKKQGAMVPLGCGVVLMGFPYFVTDLVPLIIVGLVFMVLPFVVRS